MGLNTGRSLAAAAALLTFTGSLVAAPTLRLSATTLGPVSIGQGVNGGTQTIEAANTGDGTLSITLASSVSWIAASVGGQRACVQQPGAQCFPLQLTLNTSSLPSGLTSGIVTVTAPGAVDAPQTIVVTVQMGGPLPGGLDVTIGQGKAADFKFYTNKYLDINSTKTSASWLSVIVDGVGSFAFGVPYHIHLAPDASMPVGTYSGTVSTAGSGDPIDNRQIPVTMRVTDKPVAVAATDKVRERLAQGAPPQAINVFLNNIGLGTLAVTDVSVTGGDWISGKAFASGATLTFDPGSLAPGVYNGTVTFTSNSATPVPSLPVEFTVVAKGAPLITFNGVVDNAVFGAGEAITGGDIAVVLGEQLSFSPITGGPAPPLATQIGGAQVLVNGNPAPMYYSSYGQLAFQVPYGLTDPALVRVVRDGQSSNTVTVKIAARAPRVLLVGAGPYGVVTFPDGVSFPFPSDAFPGLNTHPASAGDTLVIYAIGLGDTSPAVPAGAPAPGSEPLARLVQTPVVNFFSTGAPSITVPADFAGFSPGFAGLYQVNVTVPANAPKGVVNLTLGFTDAISNAVQIAVR